MVYFFFGQIEQLNTNTLRDYWPPLLIEYNQCLRQLPEKSSEENLKAVFKIMWKMNLLLKSVLGDRAVTHIEPRHINESNIDMKSTLNEVYKAIWKLNSLLTSEFHINT